MTLRQKLKFWLYGSCPGFAGSFRYFGAQVHFPKNSLAFREACEQDVFEAANVRLLLAFVRPGTWFFDVGANIGLMSLPVLRYIPDCRVMSFEPSPNALPWLAQTIERSAYRDRWTLLPKAVGVMEGKTQFSLAAQQNSLYDGLKSTNRVESVGQVEVEMTTLDKCWRDFGSPQVSVIKCDVEGAELEVLKGASACLASQRPHVILEWNQTNIQAYGHDAGALLELAREFNYALHGVPSLVRIDSARELSLHMKTTESFLLAPS